MYNYDNRVPLIEYNYLINLILKYKNIDLSIAKEITIYLKPVLYKYNIQSILDKNTFFEKINISKFFLIYNLKYKLFNKLIPLYNVNIVLNKDDKRKMFYSYFNNYSNVSIFIRRYKKDNNTYYYYICYRFDILYFLEIEYFKYDLYSSNFEDYIKFKDFNEFDNYCIMLFNENSGILMEDYIFSSPIKKYLYYHIFKKCILPFIKYMIFQ